MKRRHLIINADDFGRSENINAAVLSCYRKGVITDTNLMVNMPATVEAVRQAKEEKRLPVGIHIVLTSDVGLANARPVTRCETLTDQKGYFLSPEPTDYFWVKTIGNWALPDVEREINAQTLLFRELMGRFPTHITSQHHIHGHPRLLPLFVALAKHYRIPLRIPIVKATMPTKKQMEKLSAQVIMTDNFLTEYKGNFHRANYRNFSRAISKYMDGTIEVMVHPAFDSKSEPEYLRKWWARELKMLKSKSFLKFIRRRDVKLINYGILTSLKND